MGLGGERIFFPYIRGDKSILHRIVFDRSARFLAAFQDPTTPAGASLSPSERAIVSEIRIVPIQARDAGFRAYLDPDTNQRRIGVPEEASVSQAMLVTALYHTVTRDDPGHANLFVMSEVDFWSGKAPERWYSPFVYAEYLGEETPALPSADDNILMGLQYLATGSMMLHEICHHLEGHQDRPMLDRIARLRRENRRAELRDLSIANEIAADRCSAERGAPAALLPDLAIVMNLMGMIVMGDVPNQTHPTGGERFARARALSGAAVSTLFEYDGPDAAPPSFDREYYDEIIAELWERILVWQSLYSVGPTP